MLEIRDLSKRFGQTRALDGVSLQVEAGQMVGIVGRSGAGKSTLLRGINGLTTPSGGCVRYAGVDVSALRGRHRRDWRRRCAMIFQQFNLVHRLDVLTNVLAGRVAHRSTPRTLCKLFSRRERALAALTLERVGMAEQILQRADTLSGGQQQRVAIARALIQEPEVILADEPIASLDPHNASLVLETLREINRHEGISVLLNVHTVEMARAHCDRILGMRDGRVVFDGTPDELDERSLAAIYDMPRAAESAPEASTPAAAGADAGGLAAVN